ncbi:MAG TPA: prepilin-type N-terminal cleavage/methylation domain-containing protein [Planctomycetaceae bacterium]|nr:prepilin-type N-terminal cleavage/methylation domain-containing protein [Planctomycetaceae bacterium]
MRKVPVETIIAIHPTSEGTLLPNVRFGSRVGRRGVSLIEVLIVVTVASVVVGVSVTMLHLILRSERDQSRAIRTTVTLSRLTEVFRADVHASTELKVTPPETGPATLHLADGAGRDIVYTADEHLLRRVETAQGAEVHRELFHFPPGSAIRFEREESPPLARVMVDVAAPFPQHLPEQRTRVAPRRTFTIEAIANRDQRFARRQP